METFTLCDEIERRVLRSALLMFITRRSDEANRLAWEMDEEATIAAQDRDVATQLLSRL